MDGDEMNDKIAMPVWSIGSFLVIMNTTMFNVSLPSIIEELDITAALGSWVVSGYSIVFALSTIVFSRLSDFIPIRILLSTGLSLLTISSIIGYLAHGFDILLAARLLQASGAGSVPSLGIVLASRYVPYERRGRAITMIASGVALGFGLGPVIGGAITEFIGWNALFLVSCLVMPLIPVLWRLLPPESQREIRFDVKGAALTAIAAASLLIAVTRLSAIFLVISLGALVMNIRHLRKAREPFVQPALFQQNRYRKLLFISFCAFALNMSMLFLMPLALADVFHKEAAAVGMLIFPGALFSSLLTRLVGRWIDRYGNYRFLLLGHLCLAAALLMIMLLFRVSAYIILVGYLIFAPSFSAVTSALSNEISRILSKELIGAGMGLVQLCQFIGGSMAVAACGNLLGWQDNQQLVSVFQHIFLLLFIVLLCSLSMLLWYMKSEGIRPDIHTLSQ
jgi:DHA2 family metal-tetracycline-proton antiporter-like MFS transporter